MALSVEEYQKLRSALPKHERDELDRLFAVPFAFQDFVASAKPDFKWYEPHKRLDAALQRVADGDLKRLMVFMPPQEGKALDVNTPIATPSGWTTMGNLKVGDAIFAGDGSVTHVIAKTEVWKDRPVFCVRADTGAVVRADANHDWVVRLDRKRDVWSVRSTQYLWDRQREMGKFRCPKVALHFGLDLPDADLPIPPYTLGVWLGDGASRAGHITQGDADREEVMAAVAGDGFATRPHADKRNTGVLGLYAPLRESGLLRNKHIPMAYLRASMRQRWELLRGLIDTDGYVSPKGQVEFTGVNRRLALDVLALTRSLGIKSAMSVGTATIGGRVIGNKYRIRFYSANAAKLSRKKVLCRDATKDRGFYLTVTPDGTADVVCIQVAHHSGTFLAGDGLLPTHNSEVVTRLFPAFYLTVHPNRWVGIGSYAMPLARGFSRDARAYYEKVTGAAGLDGIRDDAGAVEEWHTNNGGGMWAVGRGGSATGRSAHLFVVDDPLKDRAEAESDTIRSNLHNWYKSVVNMRLQPENAVIVVNTRWHEDDLSGHLLALEKAGGFPEHWHIVDLPGICEEQSRRPKYPSTCTVEQEWRKVGEPLGGRYAISRYQQVRAISGPREYESQIQQRPSAQEGAILKRNWWSYYDPNVVKYGWEFTVISVDCAFKDTDGSDYVAMQVWSAKHGKAYLREKVRARLDYVATKDTLRALIKRYPMAVVLVEDKANGSAVIADLRQDLTGIIAVNPEGGKTARAYSVQGLLSSGKCVLPAQQVNGAWQADELITEFINECAGFPNATHDDEVDAFTQAMDKLRSLVMHGKEPSQPNPHDPDRHPGFTDSGARRDQAEDEAGYGVRVPVPRMVPRGEWK